jgi:hypothetical protein
MNEFQAKKLGEVLAFEQIGIDTLTKAFEAYEIIFEASEVSRIEEQLTANAELIKEIAANAQVEDIVMQKSEKTGVKLRQMRDLYIGEQWDNPSEIAEWLGFQEGAAYVHWRLVEGAEKASHLPHLKQLAKGATDFHISLLELSSKYLEKLGKTKK